MGSLGSSQIGKCILLIVFWPKLPSGWCGFAIAAISLYSLTLVRQTVHVILSLNVRMWHSVCLQALVLCVFLTASLIVKYMLNNWSSTVSNQGPPLKCKTWQRHHDYFEALTDSRTESIHFFRLSFRFFLCKRQSNHSLWQVCGAEAWQEW